VNYKTLLQNTQTLYTVKTSEQVVQH